MRTLVLFAITASIACAQFRPVGFDPELKAHLELTDDQVARIQRNNNEVTMRLQTDTARTGLLMREISVEIAKPSPDPMAVGMRYAELENLCRQQSTLRTRAREQNLAALTEAQRTRLKALEEAARLTSLVGEAQSANLYRRTALSFADFLLGFGGTGSLGGLTFDGPATTSGRCAIPFGGIPFLPGLVLP